MHLAKTLGRLALFFCLCCGTPHLPAAEISVFAAASLTEALREIAAGYQKQTGNRILFNFAGSSTLARQIEEGAPADLFFSADEAQMNRLEKKGAIVAQSRKDLLSNSLVIVVAARNGARIHSPTDLTNPGVRRITLGDPKAVPIGVYARRYLDKLGLWEALAPKVVATENVRGALAAVEAGNAEASIVYRTDALVSKKVVIAYSVPLSESPKISYPVALVRGAEAPEAAQQFLGYLSSPSAATVFEKQGFVVLSPKTHP
jgi:molybdate transport system substrate-binding protein